MAEVKAVTDETFEQVVLNAERPIIVDFWATWCGPCGWSPPSSRRSRRSTRASIDVVKMDVDANPGVSQALQIMTLPTIAFFRPGQQPMAVVGARSGGAVRGKLRAFAVRYEPRVERERRPTTIRISQNGASPSAPSYDPGLPPQAGVVFCPAPISARPADRATSVRSRRGRPIVGRSPRPGARRSRTRPAPGPGRSRPRPVAGG